MIQKPASVEDRDQIREGARRSRRTLPVAHFLRSSSSALRVSGGPGRAAAWGPRRRQAHSFCGTEPLLLDKGRHPAPVSFWALMDTERQVTSSQNCLSRAECPEVLQVRRAPGGNGTLEAGPTQIEKAVNYRRGNPIPHVPHFFSTDTSAPS